MTEKQKKKRLESLVEAVSSILGDQQKAKKLRKKKALARFITKLETKCKEMEDELERGSPGRKTRKERTRQIARLHKEIARAKKLLESMK